MSDKHSTDSEELFYAQEQPQMDSKDEGEREGKGLSTLAEEEPAPLGAPEQTADDSGVTVLAPDEGEVEERVESQTGPTEQEEMDAGHGEGMLKISPVAPDSVLRLSVPLSDSDGEEAVSGGSEEEEEEEDEEEEEELVVLDPEHPLMKRFQSALKSHLSRQLEKIYLDVREKLAMERAEVTQRENLGVELYGVQQELARLQMALEKRHETNAQAAMDRHCAEEELERVRSLYRNIQNTADQHRTKVAQLQTEVENLALRLFYMQGVNADLRSDITVMKHATRKARVEKVQAEGQKKKQDLLVDRLTQRVQQLTEQIALYEVQIAAQAQETRAAQETVSEAQMEMDSLAVERKQLLQQWNSSLIGMRRRDEAHTAMLEALRLSRHQVQSLDTEIDGYKKSITHEEEQNEALTELLNRAQQAGATMRKLVSHNLAQQEALKSQYSTYTRTLQETEQALSRVTADCTTRQGELSALRKQIEKESTVRLGLEEKIMAKMQEQLTHDKAAKYSRRLAEKLAANKRETEAQLSRLENEIAQVSLEGSEVSVRLRALEQTLAELEREAAGQHELVSRSEAEIARRVTLIERKQSTINLYNKRIEQITASTGHEDLGPLEIEASTLSKQLEEVGSQTAELQQYWLRQEGELVRLSRERQAQATALQTFRRQLTILQQRKVRKESEIHQERQEQGELERHMKSLAADMLKLNTLLSQNSSMKEVLQQGNSLMETEFLHKLKDAERQSVQMQMKLERIQEEKERLLNSLVEAERQIMLWEKKTQLARETREAVDSEVGQGEIRTMKAEIHRMEVRYGQLMKQQERLLREMEAAVSRRETTVTRGEAQARADRKQLTRSDLQGVLQRLSRKIQDAQKEAEKCDSVISELQDTQKTLGASLEDKQQHLAELQAAGDILSADLQGRLDTKDRNLAQIVSLQGRAKQLQAVREGRYSAVARSGSALDTEMQRQEDRLHTISTILHRVCQEYPQHQGALRRVSLALAARLQPHQDSA
nr:PREDICTED: coiled-coil domain-containing protein 40 isoform X1 [Lepisosteus oculatus]